MAGLDSNGFTIETLDELIADIEQQEQGAFGQAFDVSADGPAGQLNGAVSDKLADLWQLAALVYTAQDPDQASGNALDQLLKQSGLTRLPATQSTVTVTYTGTNGTIVDAGTTFSVVGSGAKFASNTSVTIAGGTGTAACTSVSPNNGFGPILAPAGTLTVIETPVGGLTSVINSLDAVVGRNTETDAAARARRVALLRNEGLGTVDAIRAKVLGVSGVIQAIVLENTSLAVDGNGTPGKAFLTLVSGGADADIEQAIFDAKPAGIQAYGTTTGTVDDSYGNPHIIGFSRPTPEPIYITVDLTASAAVGAYGGNAAVKQALVTYGNTFVVGQDVIRSLLYGVIESVSGILDVTNIRLGFSSSPSGTSNLTIGAIQLATFDTSRVVVNSTLV